MKPTLATSLYEYKISYLYEALINLLALSVAFQTFPFLRSTREAVIKFPKNSRGWLTHIYLRSFIHSLANIFEFNEFPPIGT